jgi:hypothetical protein
MVTAPRISVACAKVSSSMSISFLVIAASDSVYPDLRVSIHRGPLSRSGASHTLHRTGSDEPLVDRIGEQLPQGRSDLIRNGP